MRGRCISQTQAGFLSLVECRDKEGLTQIPWIGHEVGGASFKAARHQLPWVLLNQS